MSGELHVLHVCLSVCLPVSLHYGQKLLLETKLWETTPIFPWLFPTVFVQWNTLDGDVLAL